MRSVRIILAIAAIGVAAPASAQQVDQNTRQQIEKIIATFDEGYSKQDAARIAGVFAKDGVLIVPIGTSTSTPARKKSSNSTKAPSKQASITAREHSPSLRHWGQTCSSG